MLRKLLADVQAENAKLKASAVIQAGIGGPPSVSETVRILELTTERDEAIQQAHEAAIERDRRPLPQLHRHHLPNPPPLPAHCARLCTSPASDELHRRSSSSAPCYIFGVLPVHRSDRQSTDARALHRVRAVQWHSVRVCMRGSMGRLERKVCI